jgi:3-deoxy-D-manno-octulosonate 8-phosphate phosphatase (KDO 8-P phosphatase)
MLAEIGIDDAQVAYVGDDLVDLGLMKRVGLPIAVADAVDEVREAAAYVTRRPGGRGAVREAAELILQAQGKWELILSKIA